MHGSSDPVQGSCRSSSKSPGSSATVPFRFGRSPPERVASHSTLQASSSSSTGVKRSVAVVPETTKSVGCTCVTGSSNVMSQVSWSALVRSAVGFFRKIVPMFGEACTVVVAETTNRTCNEQMARAPERRDGRMRKRIGFRVITNNWAPNRLRRGARSDFGNHATPERQRNAAVLADWTNAWPRDRSRDEDGRRKAPPLHGAERASRAAGTRAIRSETLTEPFRAVDSPCCVPTLRPWLAGHGVGGVRLSRDFGGG